MTRPANTVGGDFYDIQPLGDGRVVIALGDVSGKGSPAALLMALLLAMFRTLIPSIEEENLEAADIASRLNVQVSRHAPGNRFITLFCAVLDADGHFTYINAGHNLPILARTTGETEMLTTKSVLLGAFDFIEYKPRQTRLNPGDVVVIYTDGVTEAVNAKNEMFSDERLEELVKQSVHLSADEIKQRILDEVISFTSGLPQGDDITLIVLKMK